MIVNLWLALRDDAQALMQTRLDWDEESQGVYSGPITDRQAKLFGHIADRARQLGVFKVDTLNTRDWNLWTVDLNGTGDLLQLVKDELDQMALDYPTQFKIIGAWRWDPGMPFGRQVGTQFVFDADGAVIGVTGTPTYPLDSRALKFMPNIKTWDADGNLLTDDPATVFTDVNLVQGQAARDFS